MKRLEGKWALVTGSTRGIGRQIVLGLAREGCNVVIHGRTMEKCEAVAEEVRRLGVEAACAPGVLGTDEGERAVIEAVRSAGISPDILYNNAAITGQWQECSRDIPLDTWREVFAVNFFALVRFCNTFIPDMIERGWGRVINVTSGIRDVPQLAAYSASKAAVDKYTADIAVELKGTGVLINTLDPGWLKTDLGGPEAQFEVETVLPGALVPALLDDEGDSGRLFRAQDYRCLRECAGR